MKTNSDNSLHKDFAKNKIIKEIVFSANSGQIKAVTFDFFDTLASRSSVTYRDFYLHLYVHFESIGAFNRIIPSEGFRHLRMSSEDNARKKKYEKEGHSEVSIFEIYEQISEDAKNVFALDCLMLANIEADFDKKNLIPSIDLVEFINAYCKHLHVCIITDTFYTENIISEFAREIGIKEDVKIFASSENKVGKYSSMFNLVENYLRSKNIAKENVIHLGDNYHSDVESPFKIGIRGMHLPYGDSAFWNEQSLVDKYWEFVDNRNKCFTVDLPMKTLVARALCRIDEYKYDEYSYFSYGVRVIGPLFSLFSNWLCQISKYNKEEKLLFMMREGDFLLNSYVAAIPEQKRISAEQFYVSRRVLKLAAMSVVDEKNLLQFFTSINDQSLGEYCRLLGLEDNDVELISERVGSSSDLPASSISDLIVKAIISDSLLIKKIINNAGCVRERFLMHLREVLKPLNINKSKPLKVGVVDVGWNGSIQVALQNIIDESGINVSITGYYLSTTSGVNAPGFHEVKPSISTFGYIFNYGEPSGMHDKFMRSPEILEQCTTSPRLGSLIGFESGGVPVLAENILPASQKVGIEQVQNGALALVQSLRPYHEYIENFCSDHSIISWAICNVLRLTCSPLDQELILFKEWLHDENLSSQSTSLVINSELDEWVSLAPPNLLQNTNMFEAYWIYANFPNKIRENPRELLGRFDQSRNEFFKSMPLGRLVYEDNSPEDFICEIYLIGDFGLTEMNLDVSRLSAKSYIQLKSLAPGLIWKINSLIYIKAGETVKFDKFLVEDGVDIVPSHLQSSSAKRFVSQKSRIMINNGVDYFSDLRRGGSVKLKVILSVCGYSFSRIAN